MKRIGFLLIALLVSGGVLLAATAPPFKPPVAQPPSASPRTPAAPQASLRGRAAETLRHLPPWKNGFSAQIDYEEYFKKTRMRKNTWRMTMAPDHRIRLESVDPGKPIAIANLPGRTYLLILPARQLALTFDQPPRFIEREGMPLFSFLEQTQRQLMEKQGKPDGEDMRPRSWNTCSIVGIPGRRGTYVCSFCSWRFFSLVRAFCFHFLSLPQIGGKD